MTHESPTPVERQHPLAILLRGIAMGAADVVPGVSGGTIAFITGIYERLLNAIGAFPRALTGELLRGRVGAFWSRMDGTFLVLLFGGIIASIITLSGAIRFALSHYPVFLWSFFFGLILASAWHVGREIGRWGIGQVLLLLIGAIAAWFVTQMSPGETPVTYWTLFGSGALAICAMILPGISGSFILLMIGMYGPILTAVNEWQLDRLGLFVTGCVVGLLSIAQVLSWAFRRYRDGMLALLTGFMLGALSKVWPWKEAISWRINSHGDRVPLEEINLLPGTYASVTGESSALMAAIGLAILGAVVVLGLEWFGRMRQARAAAS